MATVAARYSVSIFAALGTVVGYLGTEVSSHSMFERLLWPSRFYNTTNVGSLIAISCIMTMGGPVHRTAVQALETLTLSGLWKGKFHGDMLGTIFYRDTGRRYIIRNPDGTTSEERQVRNDFWIGVMRLITYHARLDEGSREPLTKEDEESLDRLQPKIRDYQQVLILKLSRSNTSVIDGDSPVNYSDSGPLTARHVAGIAASESMSCFFGLVTATAFRSGFTLWYIFPLTLKLVALAGHVRRTPIKRPKKDKEGQLMPEDRILCEVVDTSQGFFLIEGPTELVLQFFHRYGYPIRGRRGLRGDRAREVISMTTVILYAMLYPFGLIAFVFAPIGPQVVWLAYQIVAVVAMHFYHFGGGDHIGTTEESVACDLSERQRVQLIDRSGERVIAELDSVTVSSAAEGRAVTEDRVREIQRRHAA
ncbi:hypothetical protein BO70DRAFT_394439 [Aspergillus heteromorphus CBS 117.55]|uniref:Uncharacterized protein n=1 Tax=Aspergillus heteromorphus CBS 117.55 TaxID=1448321 RepID=A0A317WNI1_9EURO|nr:uncharacterized protein BO70DRAFT_394439 [Aspergillus heteromorphus CBS 117.55]PWY87555.1 hypothetical protein BO70DRAFT_394439 [Aspergillus heteromorphus CBS 117.55]